MNNYEYILASLPVPEADPKTLPDTEQTIAQIRELLSAKDLKTADALLAIYGDENPGPDFYKEALRSSNKFLREYIRFDLCLRNSKVAYLNEALGRPEGTDVMPVDYGEPEYAESIASALRTPNLLDREKALDDLVWARADELTALHIFDLDLILGFIVKLKIIDRWRRLDAETGRELLRRFVNEIKETYTI